MKAALHVGHARANAPPAAAAQPAAQSFVPQAPRFPGVGSHLAPGGAATGADPTAAPARGVEALGPAAPAATSAQGPVPQAAARAAGVEPNRAPAAAAKSARTQFNAAHGPAPKAAQAPADAQQTPDSSAQRTSAQGGWMPAVGGVLTVTVVLPTLVVLHAPVGCWSCWCSSV